MWSGKSHRRRRATRWAAWCGRRSPRARARRAPWASGTCARLAATAATTTRPRLGESTHTLKHVNTHVNTIFYENRQFSSAFCLVNCFSAIQVLVSMLIWLCLFEMILQMPLLYSAFASMCGEVRVKTTNRLLHQAACSSNVCVSNAPIESLDCHRLWNQMNSIGAFKLSVGAQHIAGGQTPF